MSETHSPVRDERTAAILGLALGVSFVGRGRHPRPTARGNARAGQGQEPEFREP